MLRSASLTTNQQYVHLIRQSGGGLFARHNPTSSQVKLGDYGYIDKNSAEFNYKGNVFDNNNIPVPIFGAKEEKSFRSSSVKSFSIDTKVEK
jgi:hypothetical protein